MALQASLGSFLLISWLGAGIAHSHQAMVRTRGERVANVVSSTVKEAASKMMQNKQLQQMAKDPYLMSSVQQLLGDQESAERLTKDPELAQSLQKLVEKDPGALAQVMKEAGFETGMAMQDIDAASTADLHSEFERLAKSDEDHMQRLKKNTEVRDDLKKTLGELVDNASADSERVRARLSAMHGAEKAKKAVSVAKDGSLVQAPAAIEDQVQSAPLSDELQEVAVQEEAEMSLDDYANVLRGQIESLRKQDNIELNAMMDNADLRLAMKAKLQERIKAQESEISFASQGEESLFDNVKV